MKEVVSVSIGSSSRDHEVEIDLLGERFKIRREGHNGDLAKAAARFAELDGTVAAFGMGGIDVYLRADGRKYFFREAKRLLAGVKQTPVVDGSGLKGPVEGSTIEYLQTAHGLDFAGKKVLMTSAVDRWGMAEALQNAGTEQVFGDLFYALDLPIIIKKWGTLKTVVRLLTPAVAQLPFSVLYPVGDKQDEATKVNPTAGKLYTWADIIAGDWQYVKKYMPPDMRGKWIITNTTTPVDVELCRERGVELLVTSTPRLSGRSFGTNLIEATMVALDNAKGELSPERYRELLDSVGFKPDVAWLQKDVAADK
ncbi:MAG: quinate 5-dehydrogenase [Coriobacteriia bacterium]|nr:quinate 5-dehydrogenase [Coriobacteriia bacterium]